MNVSTWFVWVGLVAVMLGPNGPRIVAGSRAYFRLSHLAGRPYRFPRMKGLSLSGNDDSDEARIGVAIRLRRVVVATLVLAMVGLPAGSAAAAGPGILWGTPIQVAPGPYWKTAVDATGGTVSVQTVGNRLTIASATPTGLTSETHFSSPSGTAVGCDQVDAGGDGAAIVTWERYSNTAPVALYATVRSPGQAAWSSPYRVAGTTKTSEFYGWCGTEATAVGPDGAATVAWQNCLLNIATACNVTASQRSPKGVWTKTVLLASARGGGGATLDVAITSSGTQIVAWSQSGKVAGSQPVEVARVEPARGAWGAPARLGSGMGEYLLVAVDQAGDAVIGWDDGTSIQTAYWSGAGWSATRTAVTTTTDFTDNASLALAGGQAVLLFGVGNSTYTVGVETSAQGGAWSQPTTLKTTAGLNNPVAFFVSEDASGDIAAAWADQAPEIGYETNVAVKPVGQTSWNVTSAPVANAYEPEPVVGYPSDIFFTTGGSVEVVYAAGYYNGGSEDLSLVSARSWNQVTPSGIVAPAPVYVALGDSVAAGEGLEKWTTEPAPNPCHRSALAYPALLAASGQFASPNDFLDVACTGAATTNILPATDSLAAPEYVNGETIQSQLDQVAAQGVPVGTVTITAGIDDLGWVQLLSGCLTYGLDTCTSYDQDVSDEIQTMSTNLAQVIADAEALPGSPTVIVTGYYDPFPTDFSETSLAQPPVGDGTCGVTAATLLATRESDHTIPLIEDWLTELNAAVEQTAQAQGATFVDLQTVVTQPDDHGICTNAPWVFPFSTKTSDQKPSAFHPTVPGQAAIAARIEATT